MSRVDQGASTSSTALAGLRPEPLSTQGLGHSATIPSAWHFIADGEFYLDRGALVYALGRYGDVYGPLPVEMFDPATWAGNMLHASHDLVAVALCEQTWREAIPHDASAIEARRAATAQTGAVHESAIGAAETPNEGHRS